MGRNLTIEYDSSGSALASGCGPTTAVTGANAYSGDGAGGGTQTVIDVSGDSPDLSGVQAGDIMLIDVEATAVRHLFEVASADNTAKTVTLTTAPSSAINTGSEKEWAIGGLRSQIYYESPGLSQYMNDWRYWADGWTIILEAGVTWSDLQDSRTWGLSNTKALIKSDTPGTQATLNLVNRTSWNGQIFGWHMEDIRLNVARAADGAGIADRCFLNRCHIHHTGGNLYDHRSFGTSTAIATTFSGWADIAIAETGPKRFIGCKFDGNGLVFDYNTNRASQTEFHDCLFIDAPSHAMSFSQINDTFGQYLVVRNCTFYNSGGDDIRFADNWDGQAGSEGFALLVFNNISKDCGGYFINDVSSGGEKLLGSSANDGTVYGAGNSMIFGNLINGATSGDYSNTSFSGYGDLSSDPLFTSETGGSEDLTLGAGSPAIDAGIQTPDAS